MLAADEAAIAAEFAIRSARSLRLAAAAAGLFGVTLLGALLAVRPADPSGYYWLQITFAVIWMTLAPLVMLYRMRRALVAYRGNLALSDE